MDDGTNQTANLFGLDLIASDDGTNTLTMLPDGLGSVRIEMVGETVNSVTTYEPYGTLLMRTGSSGTVYGYTGEQMDGATGLTYLRARYYNPSINQFQTKDPWTGNIQQPYTLNGFNYGNGNPVRYVDLSGLCGRDRAITGYQFSPSYGTEYSTIRCNQLKSWLEDYYGISITGIWNFEEIIAVSLALEDMEVGLGGISYFRRSPLVGTKYNRVSINTATNNTVENNLPDWLQQHFGLNDRHPDVELSGNGAVGVTSGHSINIYNAATTSQDWLRWAIIHESGHVWDQQLQTFGGNTDNGLFGWDDERIKLVIRSSADICNFLVKQHRFCKFVHPQTSI